MIRHDVEQNELDWMILRCGIPTASQFGEIITPAKAEPSKSSGPYMNSILAELMMGHPLTAIENKWMDRGHELEDEAVRNYEFLMGVETVRGGFVTTDDGLVGTSPDRLIPAANKGLEIKCPKPAVHVGYLLDRTLATEYKPQLQGLMWICECDSWDILSHHPEMEPALMTVTRDEAYLAKLIPAVQDFALRLQEKIAELITRGLIKPNWRELMKPKTEEYPDVGDLGLSAEDLEFILADQRSRNG